MSQLNVSTVRDLAGTGTPDTNQLGQNQTYQKPVRTSGTTYTNTTGRPIFVTVYWGAVNGSWTITVNGVSWVGATSTQYVYTTSFIVPANGTYSVTGALQPTDGWIELRT